MKVYKKVKLIAKNQISGSYAAGCPLKHTGKECIIFYLPIGQGCKGCERSK